MQIGKSCALETRLPRNTWTTFLPPLGSHALKFRWLCTEILPPPPPQKACTKILPPQFPCTEIYAPLFALPPAINNDTSLEAEFHHFTTRMHGHNMLQRGRVEKIGGMRNRDPHRENIENILAICLPILTMQHVRQSPSARHVMRKIYGMGGGIFFYSKQTIHAWSPSYTSPGAYCYSSHWMSTYIIDFFFFVPISTKLKLRVLKLPFASQSVGRSVGQWDGQSVGRSVGRFCWKPEKKICAGNRKMPFLSHRNPEKVENMAETGKHY